MTKLERKVKEAIENAFSRFRPKDSLARSNKTSVNDNLLLNDHTTNELSNIFTALTINEHSFFKAQQAFFFKLCISNYQHFCYR